MATTTEFVAVKGTVKSYSTKKGFGFIDCKDEARRGDVFVYNTHLVGRVGLVPGEEVEFTLFLDDERRPQARNVRVTNSAPQTVTNAREHPLEALTEAISRAPPVDTVDVVNQIERPLHESIRDEALKAQAAQAIEVPTQLIPPVSNVHKKLSDLEEQIRVAQTQAVEGKRTGTGVVGAVTEEDWAAHQASWDYSMVESKASNIRGGKLPAGAEVRVTDFPAPQIVGCKGIVGDYDPATDRYIVEVDVPARADSAQETQKASFSFRINQLRIEKIPLPERSSPKDVPAEESTLSAAAEPFNPMGSALEWEAAQALNYFSRRAGTEFAGKSAAHEDFNFERAAFESFGKKGDLGGMKGMDEWMLRNSMKGADVDLLQKGDFLASKGLAATKGASGFLPPGKGDLFGDPRDFMMMKGAKDSALQHAKGKSQMMAGKASMMMRKGDLMIGKGKATMDQALAEKGALLAKGGRHLQMAAKGEIIAATGGDPFAMKGLGFGDPLMAAAKGEMMGKGPFGKGELLGKGPDPMLEFLGKTAPAKGMPSSKGDLLAKGELLAAKGELSRKGTSESMGKPDAAALAAAKGGDSRGKGLLSGKPAVATDGFRLSQEARVPKEPEKERQAPVAGPQVKDEAPVRRYNPAIAGNPGYAGAQWKVRECDDFQYVIIRKGKDVLSAETQRLLPNDICVQDGPMETLESGVVRMPIRDPTGANPEGWVTVHARLLNGPTFLDLVVSTKEEGKVAGTITDPPSYKRSELLHVGQVLGKQILDPSHGIANIRVMRMPELCKDHTRTSSEDKAAKMERREERKLKKERDRAEKESA